MRSNATTYLDALLANANTCSPCNEPAFPPSIESVDFIHDDTDRKGDGYYQGIWVDSRQMSLLSNEYALRVVRLARLLDEWTRLVSRELVRKTLESFAVVQDIPEPKRPMGGRIP